MSNKYNLILLFASTALAVNFDDNFPGFQSVEPKQAFRIIDGTNPIQIYGSFLGAGTYPASDWTNWVNSARCNTPNGAATGATCTTAAIVQSAADAAEEASQISYANGAAVRFIGPVNNYRTYYNEDRGQGLSCPQCAAPAGDQSCAPWYGGFLDGSGYSFSWSVDKKVKVTCKKSCGVKDINRTNLESALRFVPPQVRSANAIGANFLLRREYSNEVLARCRLTIVGDARYLGGRNWLNDWTRCPDLVYGGQNAGECFAYA